MPDTYDFEIYFFGLICIHGDSKYRKTEREKKSHAMLYRDGVHEQLIYVNDPTKITLASDVTFNNLPGGPARALSSFTALVPHLEDLTAEGIELKLDANIWDVTLPGGLLATVDLYDTISDYELGGYTVSSGCVGRLTLLQVTTVRPEVVVKFNNAEERAPSDGWVLIANREVNANNDGAESNGRKERPDFKKHRNFTTAADDDQIATLYEHESDYCETTIRNPANIVARHLRTVLNTIRSYPVYAHPECSNTNWP